MQTGVHSRPLAPGSWTICPINDASTPPRRRGLGEQRVNQWQGKLGTLRKETTVDGQPRQSCDLAFTLTPLLHQNRQLSTRPQHSGMQVYGKPAITQRRVRESVATAYGPFLHPPCQALKSILGLGVARRQYYGCAVIFSMMCRTDTMYPMMCVWT